MSRNPYEDLPQVASFEVVSTDVAKPGTDASKTFGFDLVSHTLGRATIVGTYEVSA